jgi:hypothetical protein
MRPRAMGPIPACSTRTKLNIVCCQARPLIKQSRIVARQPIVHPAMRIEDPFGAVTPHRGFLPIQNPLIRSASTSVTQTRSLNSSNCNIRFSRCVQPHSRPHFQPFRLESPDLQAWEEALDNLPKLTVIAGN